jgi:hypothetical protein
MVALNPHQPAARTPAPTGEHRLGREPDISLRRAIAPTLERARIIRPHVGMLNREDKGERGGIVGPL